MKKSQRNQKLLPSLQIAFGLKVSSKMKFGTLPYANGDDVKLTSTNASHKSQNKFAEKPVMK